jgi:porphobilinogen synthase
MPLFKPYIRPRRLRGTPEMRRLVRESHLSVDDFIYPLFVTHEKGAKKAIASMPGQFQLGIEQLVQEVHEAKALGLPAVILFGIPESKDALGSDACDDNHGIIQQAVRAVK